MVQVTTSGAGRLQMVSYFIREGNKLRNLAPKAGDGIPVRPGLKCDILEAQMNVYFLAIDSYSDALAFAKGLARDCAGPELKKALKMQFGITIKMGDTHANVSRLASAEQVRHNVLAVAESMAAISRYREGLDIASDLPDAALMGASTRSIRGEAEELERIKLSPEHNIHHVDSLELENALRRRERFLAEVGELLRV